MRPRDLVLSHLAAVGEVADPGGLASAALSEAIGYRGTNVAFAQLLYEMERSGLIEREVRGKRTYRITLASAPAGAVPAGAMPIGAASSGAVPAVSERGAGGGIDYEELARRLLDEIVRRNVEEAQRGLRAENARLRELLAEARPDLGGDEEAARLMERLLDPRRGDGPSRQSA